MLIRWGSYTHPSGTVKLSIERTPVFNEGQQQMAIREAWRMRGLLYSQNGGPADIDAQIAALMDAYATGGKDLILYMPDGSTPTATRLRNVDTLGGTRVTQLVSFPTTEGVERVNLANYEVTVEGEFPLSQDFILVSFKERLSFNGGGPIIGWLKPSVGQPVQQLVREQDTFRVIQSGSSVGYLAYPEPALPIWPAFLTKAPDIDYDSPEKMGDGQYRFGVVWKYEFEADIPLIGVPNSW